MNSLLKQSSTAQPLVFLMVDSADHITGKTGLAPTVTLSKSGGSFASPAGAVSELGNGWYAVAGNATDTATLGPLILHASATGADPVDALFEVVGWDVQAANLPANVAQIAGQTASASGTVTFPGTVASTTNITAGTITTVTTLTNLPAAPTDWLTAVAVKADAVTKIQAGLSTYAGGDTTGTTTLLSRVTGPLLLASGYTAPDNTSITAIKAKTDNLPSSPAAVGSAMALTGDLTATMKTSISGLTIANVTTVATIGDSRIASILTAVTTPAATPTTDDIAAAVKTAIFSTAMYTGSTTPVYTFPQFGAIITRIDKRAGDTWGLIPPMSDQVRWTYYAAVETCTVDGSVITLYDGTTLTCTSAGRETVLAG